MKKVFAIVMLTIYMVSTTELYQLLKVPLLIEHFIEHKDENPAMSFIGFLVQHYDNHLENHPYNDDYQKDRKLPFLAHTDVLNLCFVSAPPLLFEITHNPPVERHLKVSVYRSVFTSSQFHSSIWQPPKSC